MVGFKGEPLPQVHLEGAEGHVHRRELQLRGSVLALLVRVSVRHEHDRPEHTQIVLLGQHRAQAGLGSVGGDGEPFAVVDRKEVGCGLQDALDLHEGLLLRLSPLEVLRPLVEVGERRCNHPKVLDEFAVIAHRPHEGSHIG